MDKILHKATYNFLSDSIELTWLLFSHPLLFCHKGYYTSLDRILKLKNFREN